MGTLTGLVSIKNESVHIIACHMVGSPSLSEGRAAGFPVFLLPLLHPVAEILLNQPEPFPLFAYRIICLFIRGTELCLGFCLSVIYHVHLTPPACLWAALPGCLLCLAHPHHDHFLTFTLSSQEVVISVSSIPYPSCLGRNLPSKNSDLSPWEMLFGN